MPCIVNCLSYEETIDSWQEWDVTPDFHVYPCCAISGYFAVKNDRWGSKWLGNEINKFEPGWNDLSKHNMESIIEKWLTIVNGKKFESPETTPIFCLAKCRKTDQ